MSVTGCKPIDGDGFDGFVCYTGNNSPAAIRERLDALTASPDLQQNDDPHERVVGALPVIATTTHRSETEPHAPT